MGLVVMILVVTATGCQRGGVSTQPLRFAVLPILDTLPLYVAEAEGYFEAEGIDVTLIPAGSAAERDQLLQAGQVDGVITDLVALALYNRDATSVIAVRYAMVPTPTFAQFRILAAGPSGPTTPADLVDVPIGVSEGTVVEYVTERVLAAEGLSPDSVRVLAVPKIPERMALLSSGELLAATLPEPLATLAMQQGAVLVADDRAHPDFSGSLFAFRAEVVESRPETVHSFLRAIDRASAAINADKGRWADLLTEKQLVPAPIAGRYPLPDYPDGGLPSEEQLADVVAWLQADDRLATSANYADIVRDVRDDG